MSKIQDWMGLPVKKVIDGKEIEIPMLGVSLVSKFMRMSEEGDAQVKGDLMQDLLKDCLKLVFPDATDKEIIDFPLGTSLKILNELVEVSGLNDESIAAKLKR